MDLHERIKKIEALIASSKNEGERQAAEYARNRILERHKKEEEERPIEYTVPLGNAWKKRLFIALCNKHHIRTYRYKRQKYTTTMLRASPTFVKNVLVPEFKKYEILLEDFVENMINDLIDQIHAIKEDDIVVAGGLTASH